MPLGCSTIAFAVGVGLALGEDDGTEPDVDGEGDPVAEGEVDGLVPGGVAVLAGGGVVPHAVTSSSAQTPPRARNEMAMHQR
ncbi:MAG TPA: hypothetical protein VM429_12355 [Micropruina sp.]|nr:hypothetical protein [Micropruina sp.]